MPVIGIPVLDLEERLCRALPREELLGLLEQMGCDVEGYAVLKRVQCAACGYVMELAGKEEAPPRCDGCGRDLRSDPAALRAMPPLEVVRMELLAVRPDMFDPGGLARALRGILGVEAGPAAYSVGPPVLTLRVDEAVRRPTSLRPHIAAAVLEGVSLDHDRIKILMKLQENLHWALGRDRKLASIGVYDLDSLDLPAKSGSGQRGEPSPELEYTAEDPEAYGFWPLGSLRSELETRPSLRRILEDHPKGRAYAHLLAGFDGYPILRTRDGLVLSMPPIINSEETKVHPGSRRILVDVTGMGTRVVHRTLDILVTSLLELLPELRLSAVRIVNATSPSAEGETVEILTPDLSPQEMEIDTGHTSRILGLTLHAEQLRDLLLRMRHGVSGVRGTRLSVQVPAYRNDILQERDLMEDAAIAFGYERIPRLLVPTATIGRELESERLRQDLREVMVGLGFLEILTLVLTSPDQSDLLLEVPCHPEASLLENPISGEQTQLRTSLLPGLLQTFARNRHHSLPQAIFELGEVTFLDRSAETGARERHHLGFGFVSPKAGFADARALVEAVVRELGWKLQLREMRSPFLIEGRAAWVLSEDGAPIGLLGEVHPQILEKLGLQNPAVVCELAVPGKGKAEPYLSFPTLTSMHPGSAPSAA